MSRKALKTQYGIYYKKYLFQFLGLQKDIFVNINGSYTFYDNTLGKIILWIMANKIQVAKNAKWINNADEWIVKNVIKEPDVVSFRDYTQQRLFTN